VHARADPRVVADDDASRAGLEVAGDGATKGF